MKKLCAIIIALMLTVTGVSLAQESDELSSAGWTITSSSAIRPASNAIDGDLSTIWHSSYKAEGSTITEKDPLPFTLEITLPEATDISGVRYYPRTDGSAAGIAKEAEIAVSENGTEFVSLGKIAYQKDVTDRTPRTVRFSGNVKVKAVRYTILASHADYGTCAELSLLKASTSLSSSSAKTVKMTEEEAAPAQGSAAQSAAPVQTPASPSSDAHDRSATLSPKSDMIYEVDEIEPKNTWKVWASSAMTDPALAMDGDMNTWWHSHYDVKDGKVVDHDLNPHEFIITFPEEVATSGVRIYPRPEGQSTSGIFKVVALEISGDGETFYPATGNVELYYGANSAASYARTPVEVTYGANVRVKAIKIIVVDSASGYAVTSEIRVLSPNSHMKESVSVSDFVKDYEMAYDWESVDKKGITVKASSEQPYPFESANDLDSTAIKTIDDNALKGWHTQYRNEDGSTVGFNKQVMPAYLQYDLGSECTLRGIGYIPRGSGFRGGHWVELSISSSDDGENFTVIDSYTLNPTQYLAFGKTIFPFREPVTARYFRVDITSSVSDTGAVVNMHATANELYFYESKADRKARTERDRERYTLVIGSKDILVEKGKDSHTTTIDVAPFIVNGTTMLPLRGLFEEMDAQVTWIADGKKIEVKGSDTSMLFQIENNRVWVGEIRYNCLVAPRIQNDRTFIPLRFISEHMGYTVSWDADTRTITIER